MPIWEWLTDQANSSTVGALGLVVTVVAFGLTIWQVAITRLEVRRAVNALDAYKARLRSEEALRLIVQLGERADRGIGYIRSGQTRQIFDNFSEIRNGLSRLLSLVDIVGSHSDDLSDSALSISNFMTSHERVRGGLPESDKQTAIASLRLLSQRVIEVDGYMKDKK